MESLTENWLNHTASAVIFQVHDMCFIPPLSEFGHIKMRNGAKAHLKTACGPPVGNHWFNSFLILLNLEKDFSPEQLVTIKLRNKASRDCIN